MKKLTIKQVINKLVRDANKIAYGHDQELLLYLKINYKADLAAFRKIVVNEILTNESALLLIDDPNTIIFMEGNDDDHANNQALRLRHLLDIEDDICSQVLLVQVSNNYTYNRAWVVHIENKADRLTVKLKYGI